MSKPDKDSLIAKLIAQALWHSSNDKSTWETETLTPAKGCIQIKSLYSLISNGTEKTVCMGKVPLSTFAQMKVPYMDGRFNLPVKYGYSVVGRIIEEGHPNKNKLVHLMHPHQDICMVAQSDFSLIPIGIPAARATLTANMETAVNACWDSGVSVGDKVLIVGGGLIGVLLGKLLTTIPGVYVAFAELNHDRKNRINDLGFELMDDPDQNFDLAFHTSGSASGLELAINKVGYEGKIVELSWYANKSLKVKLGDSFHYDRKQIISSQVGRIPGHKSNRWDFKRRKETVFDILKDPWFDQLISLITMEDTIKHFDQLRSNMSVPIAPVIKY